MANFGPLMAEICSGVWGTPANKRVSPLGFVTTATSPTRGQQNFARSLAVSWADTLLYIFVGSCQWRIHGRGEGGDRPPRRPPAQKTATPAMFLLRTKREFFVIFVSVKHSRSFNCLSSHILCRHMQLVCRCVSSDSCLYVSTENDKTYANAQLKRFNACC